MEKDSNHRSDTFFAEKPPKIVSTTQTPTTSARRRWTRWASRASTCRGSTRRTGTACWRLAVRLSALRGQAIRLCFLHSHGDTPPGHERADERCHVQDEREHERRDREPRHAAHDGRAPER